MLDMVNCAVPGLTGFALIHLMSSVFVFGPWLAICLRASDNIAPLHSSVAHGHF